VALLAYVGCFVGHFGDIFGLAMAVVHDYSLEIAAVPRYYQSTSSVGVYEWRVQAEYGQAENPQMTRKNYAKFVAYLDAVVAVDDVGVETADVVAEAAGAAGADADAAAVAVD